jgi:hypothetical protein
MMMLNTEIKTHINTMEPVFEEKFNGNIIKSMILSYFDATTGPRILMMTNTETYNAELEHTIVNLMDISEN